MRVGLNTEVVDVLNVAAGNTSMDGREELRAEVLREEPRAEVLKEAFREVSDFSWFLTGRQGLAANVGWDG